MSLEDGADLIIKATVSASKSLVRDSTGFRFERSFKIVESTQGQPLEFSIPTTDSAGWRDAATQSLIDVSAPGSYTHRYSAVVELFDGMRAVGTSFTLGPFTVPAGAEPLDLDKMLLVGNVAGGQVLIPDVWSTLIAQAQAAAQAAAVSAQQAAASAANFDGSTYVTLATLENSQSAQTIPVVRISNATAVGKNVLLAADAAAARVVIGAGTSSLALGTTPSTAKRGDYVPTLADTPARSAFLVIGSTRLTSRTDIPHIFINAADVPIVVPPSLAGMYEGDIQIKTA